MRTQQRRFGVDRTPAQIVRNFVVYVSILGIVLFTPIAQHAPYFLFNIMGTALSCATIVVITQMFNLVISVIATRRYTGGSALSKGRGSAIVSRGRDQR